MVGAVAKTLMLFLGMTKAVSLENQAIMRIDDIEKQMRLGECFHQLRVPPHVYTIIRVDGRSFSSFTENHRMADGSCITKPFDHHFHLWMVEAATQLLHTLQGIYAYTESDEISVLLPLNSTLFDREVEKLVSISAARTAAAFSIQCNEIVDFDARIWVGGQLDDVVDYFQWRQSDASRCALNGCCYWTLRKEGMSAAKANSSLAGTTVAQKNEILFQRGINFNELPAWQKRGVAITWISYEKEGVNPTTGQASTTTRRKTAVTDIPLKDHYRDFLTTVLQRSLDTHHAV
jgi:tRNA(His) 5'-end guanylyltransferase